MKEVIGGYLVLFSAMEGGVAVVCERVYLCIRENVCMIDD